MIDRLQGISAKKYSLKNHMSIIWNTVFIIILKCVGSVKGEVAKDSLTKPNRNNECVLFEYWQAFSTFLLFSFTYSTTHILQPPTGTDSQALAICSFCIKSFCVRPSCAAQYSAAHKSPLLHALFYVQSIWFLLFFAVPG